MKIQKNINRLVFVLAIVFWVVHSYFDSLLSAEGISFIQSCFNPDADDLLLRGFVILLFLIFCVFSERLVKVINNMALEIQDHQDQFENTISQHHAETTQRLHVIKELEKLAETDPLTSLFNRRKFNEMLRYETERNQRYQLSLALIMCDIDHFKRINDRFGHDIGDKALKVFTKKITANIRDIDIFARWGGEEFMILMPNSTIENATTVAEKLRKLIVMTDIEQIDVFTASFGVTGFKVNDTIESFIKRADDALYKAKEGGRNKVVAIA